MSIMNRENPSSGETAVLDIQMDTEGTASDDLSDSVTALNLSGILNQSIEGVSQIPKMLNEDESSSSNHNPQTKPKQTVIEEQ